jgi:hypothetical protein
MRRLTDEHLALTHDHSKRLWPILVEGLWLAALRDGQYLASSEASVIAVG